MSPIKKESHWTYRKWLSYGAQKIHPLLSPEIVKLFMEFEQSYQQNIWWTKNFSWYIFTVHLGLVIFCYELPVTRFNVQFIAMTEHELLLQIHTIPFTAVFWRLTFVEQFSQFCADCGRNSLRKVARIITVANCCMSRYAMKC